VSGRKRSRTASGGARAQRWSNSRSAPDRSKARWSGLKGSYVQSTFQRLQCPRPLLLIRRLRQLVTRFLRPHVHTAALQHGAPRRGRFAGCTGHRWVTAGPHAQLPPSSALQAARATTASPPRRPVRRPPAALEWDYLQFTACGSPAALSERRPALTRSALARPCLPRPLSGAAAAANDIFEDLIISESNPVDWSRVCISNGEIAVARSTRGRGSSAASGPRRHWKSGCRTT
jgi:hypothetical protein